MATISGIQSTTNVYIPTVTKALDIKGGLVEAKLPNSTAEDTNVGWVYSAKGLPTGASVPSSAIYLKDTTGNYFSIDADKVSMVAGGKDLNLYVFQADGSADKYTFDVTNGNLRNASPTNVTAADLTAVEIFAKRDLDGDTSIGAKLVRAGADNGLMDTTGGLFKVSGFDQDMWVVGAGLDKGKAIDASKSTLLNADGSNWSPDGDFSKYSAVATSTAGPNNTKVTTWSVYATDAEGNVTRFNFDANRKLIESDTKVLSTAELAATEKLTKRDLNKDQIFGVTIETNAVDATVGLYKGSLQNQNYFLVGTALKTGTASAPTDLKGSLLTGDNEAWNVTDGYVVSAGVKTTTGFTVYAYESSGGSTNQNNVLRFDFTKNADGNYVINSDSVDGTEMTVNDLVNAEKAAKRDLNKDGVFGVALGVTLDKVGGLYAAQALGNDFLLVGNGLSKPNDLSTALRNSDGSAWTPDGVDFTHSVASARIVARTGGYDVYVKDNDGNFSKYGFDSSYTLTSDKENLTTEQVASAEVSTRRDLNGDSAFGFKVSVSGLMDAKGGLYKGEFQNEKAIYLVSETQKLTVGSKVANNAVDLTNALKTDAGYWDVDAGYSVKSGYRDSGNYVLIATSTTDATDVRKYTFDANNTLNSDESGAMTLAELTAQEKTLNRDLNGDKIAGVKTSATMDKIGGLHTVTMGTGDSTQVFLTVGAKASDVKDLSTTLKDAQGEAWKLATGETVAAWVTEKSGSTTTGYALYTKANVGNEGAYEIKRYNFGTDFAYDESRQDNSKVLSAIELADAEASSFRDINGDKSVGARVSGLIDKTSGLYQATINSGSGDQNYLFVSSTPPGRATGLSGKYLTAMDETTPWQVDTGYTIKAMVTSVEGYDVIANNGTSFNRYSFDSNRTLIATQALNLQDFAAYEKSVGRDLNSDKAVGANIAQAIDRTSALYKANVTGQDFYIVGATPGAALKTGTNGATAVDLSRALMDTDGVTAWKPEDNNQIGGMIKTSSGYNVYTYQKTDGVVSSVNVHSWDNNLKYLQSTAADPLALVEVEKTALRDLSGDGAVGFRTMGSLTEGYMGVTQGKVFGSTTYLLAGSSLKSGTSSAPLSIKDALLNVDGSAPWEIPDGYAIKAVDDNDSTLNAGKRYVYSVNSTNQVRRFEFDKTTGKISANSGSPSAMTGDPVTAAELAAKEISRNRDLNGDAKTGVVSISTITDSANTTRPTGLIRASFFDTEYILIGKAPSSNQSLSLDAALRNGSAPWELPSGFDVKGVYQPDDNTAEVYGILASDLGSTIHRYTFTKTSEDPYYRISDANGEDVEGIDLAAREASALKDLNGDSSIGYQYQSTVFKQLDGFAVGTASLSETSIYIVGNNINRMGLTSANLANTAALIDARESPPTYWKPATDETVINLYQASETQVNVYTKLINNDQTTSYVRHQFDLTNGAWQLQSIDTLGTSTEQIWFADEVAANRDFTGDNNIGT